MIDKLAASLDMSFKVPDSEKRIAQTSLRNFLTTVNGLSIAKDHLDLMYGPFKKAQSISVEALTKFRGKLNRFKNQMKKNFKKVREHAFNALKTFNYFSTDTHCIELINAFKESMNDLIQSVIKFIEILNDFKVDDFKDKVIIAIDNIKKESAQIESLIRDRIIDHIKKNIIGESWITSDNNVKSLEEKVPMVIEIYKKINEGKDLNDHESFVQIQKKPQSLNFSDSQRVLYPQDMRQEGQTST
jgi:hypothetical protein